MPSSAGVFGDPGPALLLIDIQSDYAMPPKFVRNVQRVISKARREKIPVFHVRYVVSSPKKTKALPFKSEIRPSQGSSYRRSGQLMPWTRKRGDSVCTKHTYDGFYQTKLHSMLRKKGVRTLYVAGMDTGVCVLNTMLSAFNMGYRVRLIESACTDSRPGRHAHTLRNYRNEIYRAAAV